MCPLETGEYHYAPLVQTTTERDEVDPYRQEVRDSVELSSSGAFGVHSSRVERCGFAFLILFQQVDVFD